MVLMLSYSRVLTRAGSITPDNDDTMMLSHNAGSIEWYSAGTMDLPAHHVRVPRLVFSPSAMVLGGPSRRILPRGSGQCQRKENKAHVHCYR